MKTVGELSRLLPIAAFGCSLAAAITMAALTYLAIPASTSQAIIGAVMGASFLSGSADFSRLYKIVSCWILTPIGGIVIAFFLHGVLEYLLEKWVRSIRYRNLFFSIGIIAAGCYGAYFLGSNNVANVTGVYVGSGLLSAQMASAIGGLSIATGVLTYSRKVMMTVGR
jgi:PiT family inorganic phosphate transporter